MKKLIAIDMDGTLLNRNNQISNENLEAIKAAQKEGIEIVIATGRAYFDVQTFFQNTGVRTWVIGANGATIHDPDGKHYYSQPIQPKLAIEILKSLEEDGFYYEVFSNDCIYTPQNGKELLQIEMDRVKSANPDVNISRLKDALAKQFSQTGFVYINSSEELADLSIDVFNILVFSFHEEKLQAGWKKYGSIPGLTIVTSAHHNFELEHQNASKGIALHKLSEKLNIPLHHTIAIGDSMNDVSMLTVAGKAVAMGNARQEVKDISDVITLTNNEHGVAKVILETMYQTHTSQL